MNQNNTIEAMKAQALQLFRAGVAAADPGALVSQQIQVDRKTFTQCSGKVFVIAIGKAARAMTQAAIEALPRTDSVLAVTNYENHVADASFLVLAAGHPVPDENGMRAALHIEVELAKTSADDLVLVLISGGASALLPAPVSGVSLDEKIALNALLLASGAPIQDMNLVRQQLSRLKGGGLARAAAPARTITYILSDVVSGDQVRSVASGPTAGALGSKSDAVTILKNRQIWDRTPDAIKAHLLLPDTAPPIADQSDVHIIGNNAKSLAAMGAAQGDAKTYPEPLEGDVQDAAETIAHFVANGPGCYLFGGETTVVVKGEGRGGRNQELALRVACELDRLNVTAPWVFLSGGTDGRDGPTDAAGGLVDHLCLQRIEKSGLNLNAALKNNDSYPILKECGCLLDTGATGTNVADLQVFIHLD